MTSFEFSLGTRRRPVITLATAALAVACSSTSHYPVSAQTAPSIQEPACTGVTLRQIDHDNFRVLPILRGQFVNPSNVRSFLDFPSPLPLGLSPGATSTTLPNTSGGGIVGMQNGVGYELGLQGDALQQPAQLVMFDFQNSTPSDLATPGGIPESVPEVLCPPTNLGKLVLRYENAGQI